MPDDPLVDRVPPHNLEAEMSVLGAMMQSTDATGLCIQHLDPNCFYRPEHGALFTALAKMFEANHAVDWVTLKAELAQQGELERVGGDEYLITLVDSVPTIANAEYYARVVKDKALLRGLIQAAAEIIRDAHSKGDPVDDVLDRCEQRIFEVVERKIVGQAHDVRSILADVMQKVDFIGKRAITGVATGFADLEDARPAAWRTHHPGRTPQRRKERPGAEHRRVRRGGRRTARRVLQPGDEQVGTGA